MGTNIGGQRENQDDGFIWKHVQSESLVLAVIDGHGSDYGAFAAQQIRLAMLEWLELNFFQVFENPGEGIRSLFEFAHERLFHMFQSYLKYQGFETQVKDGYVLRSSNNSKWLAVKGGATISLVVLLQNGFKIFTANLGDCTAIISFNGKSLSKQMLIPLYVENELEELKFTEEEMNEKSSNSLEITWNHGADSLREFRRMRVQRPSEEDPRLPYLIAIYDMEGKNATDSPKVFTVDGDGNPSLTNTGQIYKNVRREWASRVITPPNADFQETLAVTRALGDFPMQSCGLTSVPDVFEVKIELLLDENDASGIIVIGSDGIWDNWKFDQVSGFFMDPVRIESASRASNALEQVEEFMQLNFQVGERNFGSEADNATCIACYVFNSILGN